MAADVSAVYPRLRPYAHDDATRCLCHAVHTDPFLREYVVHTVVEPHLRAVCPAFGVDLLAVARHAVQAQHRWKTHQYVFVAIRLILLADLAMAILTGWLTVAAGVLAAAVAAAFLTHFWALRVDRLAALKAVTEPSDPADQADPLPPSTETRIEALTAANVIVYAQNEFDPFIGSGRRLHWYQLNPVDITRPGRDSSGNQKVIRPFDAVSLHQYLARKVPALGFDGLRPRNRLYVQGDEVPHVPGLLPDHFAEPEPAIDSDLVKSGVQHPTEWARTYICMEQVLSGGDLVVSMYVRAWIKNGLLTIERIIYYLPPLQPRYRPTAEFAAGTALSVSITTLATAARQFTRVLAGKRIGRLQASKFARTRRRDEARARRAIKSGVRYDYGARTSLREAVAAYSAKEHFKESDILSNAKSLGARLMDCIEQFLDDHGVDTSDFHDQIQLINTSVSNIGTLQVGNAVFGGEGNIISGHGQVNNPPGPAGGGQPGTQGPQGQA